MFTIIAIASSPIEYCVKPFDSELVKLRDEVPMLTCPECTLLMPTLESPPLTVIFTFGCLFMYELANACATGCTEVEPAITILFVFSLILFVRIR